MSRVHLTASYALWLSRERYRYSKWRHYVKTKPVGDPLREKWYGLYVEARDLRKRRAWQLSKLEVTHVDTVGRAFIMREEGSRTHPYEDSEGYCTVGVGHLLHKSACTADDHRKWTLTQHEVDALLAKDLAKYEAPVRAAFKDAKLDVTQPRFNACVSLCLNIGTAGFAGSTVAKRIKAGDLHGAAEGFLMWVRPAVLEPRRRRERDLFLS